jgi:hypothetical protein
MQQTKQQIDSVIAKEQITHLTAQQRYLVGIQKEKVDPLNKLVIFNTLV